MRFARLAAVLAAFFMAVPAFAQPTSAIQSVYPMTRDLGALVTLTAQGAGTVSSTDQSGYNVSRITCVFRSASQGGTPSSTFTIQGKDSVSGQYYSLITSAAVTTSPTTNVIYAGSGVASTTNVSAALPISRNWRVSITVGGGSPSVTGTIGCSVQ